MKIFINTLEDGGVHVQARLEGPGAIGDISRDMGPTDKLFGWTGAELAALGDGEQDIEPKSEAAPAAG